MGKLFVSLYVYIIISIFILSGALEKFWPEPEGVEALPLAPEVSQMIRLLAANPDGINTLQGVFQSQLITRNQVAFLPEQSAQLERGQAVAVFSGARQIIWYLKVNQTQLLKIGPYHFDANSYDSVWPFFLMLIVIGLPVATWSYWLWRDFSRLEAACQTIQAPEEVKIKVEKKSLLLPITRTLVAMKARIKALLDDQRDLTASVSHEIRTPLARLKFALAMLEESSNEQKFRPYLLSMQSDIVELEQLVTEMLDFAKLEREKPQLLIAPYNLTKQVEGLVTKMGFSTNVDISIHDTTTNTVCADAHFLGRAIQNLLGNAIKYAKTRIEIKLMEDEKTVFIKVADDGDGIQQSEWDTVFKPFTRLDKSRNKKINGFGLGLAIVEKITLWHDGMCYLEHTELGGACFVLAIPKTNKYDS